MTTDIFTPAEGGLYSRYELDVLGPRLRARFKIIRRYGSQSEYPGFWTEARNAARADGRLPMVVTGRVGRLTCLVPAGLTAGAKPNPQKFEAVSEWSLLAMVDAEISNSAQASD